MENDRLSKSETRTLNWLIKETKDKLKQQKMILTITSGLVFVAIAILIYSYWINPNLSNLTSIIIGGQLYTVYGAVLSATGAFTKISTIGLMSMARWDGNPKLFYELRKSSMASIVGICFIGFGFLIQSIGMIINEFVGL
jgi:hypothetical protein